MYQCLTLGSDGAGSVSEHGFSDVIDQTMGHLPHVRLQLQYTSLWKRHQHQRTRQAMHAKQKPPCAYEGRSKHKSLVFDDFSPSLVTLGKTLCADKVIIFGLILSTRETSLIHNHKKSLKSILRISQKQLFSIASSHPVSNFIHLSKVESFASFVGKGQRFVNPSQLIVWQSERFHFLSFGIRARLH